MDHYEFEEGDLFCRKYSYPTKNYQHIPIDNPFEWYKSSDASALEYSFDHLQTYNEEAEQYQWFINLNLHFEFASTYKGVWCDGCRIVCIDDELTD